MLATGGFASGGLELSSNWEARETALGLPVAGVPARGEQRFEPEYFARHAMNAAGVRGRLLAAPGRRRRRLPCTRTCWSRARRWAGGEPWREKSGDGISLVDGLRGGGERAGGGEDDRGGEALMAVGDPKDVLGPLLMRESLDHCVKCTICETYCPVAAGHAAVPGPEVRGPAGRALPRAGRAVGRRVAGLLLGLRDLHAGLPAGRAHRRDQHAGAREDARAHGLQAARPDHRPPDARGPARDAGRADRERDAEQPACCGSRPRRRSGCTATPRCRSSPGARCRGGRASTARPTWSARSPSSTAAAPTTTSRGSGA